MYVRLFALFRECYFICVTARRQGLWHSAPFWPMISAGGDKFSDFVVDWMDLPSLKEAFIPGRCNSVFGNENLNFRMLALRIHFV